MTSFYLQDLETWSGGQWLGKRPQQVAGFSINSRNIHPGAAFIALKTGRRDGHDFIPQACEAGASCAIVSEPNPSVSLPQLVVADTVKALQSIAAAQRALFTGAVIAVSGSCGKTTSKDLLARLMGERCLKTQGNLNNYLGVPLTLSRLNDEEHSHAVIEAGINEPGEMAMLADLIRANLVIITMVGHSHLEKLQSVEQVAVEKAKLLGAFDMDKEIVFPMSCLAFESFQKLLPVATVVVNRDETTVFDTTAARRVISYSIDERSNGVAQVVSDDVDGGEQRYQLPFVSPGLISNSVLSIYAARRYGVSAEDVSEALRGWQPSAHRGVWLNNPHQLIYDDSYNANPDSMKEALAVFHEKVDTHTPRLYVLGGMRELGKDSTRLHASVGRKLVLGTQDQVILIGQEALGYAQGILEMMRHGVIEPRIQAFSSIEAAESSIVSFNGAIFLKGSNSYNLSSITRKKGSFEATKEPAFQ